MPSTRRTHESIALFVLVMDGVPNYWSGFLPSLFTIATFSGGDEAKTAHTREWIRRGEIQAVALSLTLGAATSMLSEEPWPLVGAIIMCGYLAWQYENALRKGISGGLALDMDQPEENTR